MRILNTMKLPHLAILLSILSFGCCVAFVSAQQPPVTMQVEVTKRAVGNSGAGAPEDPSDVVVWLSPLNHPAGPPPEMDAAHRPQLVQRNKMFEPHILVVQVGTLV